MFASRKVAHHRKLCVVICAVAATCLLTHPIRTTGAADNTVTISDEVLLDKIHGGLLGQLLGNLNGLPHEMKYLAEPGNVLKYTPALPNGARTDDDTDIEWVYVVAMQREKELLLPYTKVRALWQRHINRKIWCANAYARGLMDLGIEPPLTGRIALNPWSVFNISGQFVCETFGLIAPAMPQTAARVGVHYTHVTVDGEPIQTTQFFTAAIALAFVENDVETIVRDALNAVDPTSRVHQVIRDTMKWCKENPDDWRATRAAIKRKYVIHGGKMRDNNGYETNTASIVGALLYGKGDFVETIRLAFCFGWDADCNAATAGTIIGVMRGARWMLDEQKWNIKDVYRNVTRDEMPNDETISGYAGRIAELAKLAIVENGGRVVTRGGTSDYSIVRQPVKNIEPLPRPVDRRAALSGELIPIALRELVRDRQARARAAYVLLCLDADDMVRQAKPELWKPAVTELAKHKQVIDNVKKAPGADVLKAALDKALKSATNNR